MSTTATANDKGAASAAGTQQADIFAQIMAVDLSAPRTLDLEKLGPGETVIGTMSDSLKRLLLFIDQKTDELKGRHTALMATLESLSEEHNRKHDAPEGSDKHTKADCLAFRAKVSGLIDKIESLRSDMSRLSKTFFGMAKLEVPPVEDMGYGIRDGFLIVSFRRQDDDALNAIAQMFGGNVMEIDMMSGIPTPKGNA
jgi:hypothetical protein